MFDVEHPNALDPERAAVLRLGGLAEVEMTAGADEARRAAEELRS